jgi:hypothetical protein
MREFFQGWRRKLGVLTLMMALVCMHAWVRSLAVEDVLDFHDFIDRPYGYFFIDGLATRPNSFALIKYELKSIVEDAPNPTPNDSKVPSSDAPQFEENGNSELQKDQPIVEVQRLVEIQPEPPTTLLQILREPLIEIPFSAIAVPLTVISAYLLLLAKPKASTQRKPPQPFPTKRA